MKKKILSVILIGCMLFGSVQGVFADEAEPADAEETVLAEEESVYSDTAAVEAVENKDFVEEEWISVTEDVAEGTEPEESEPEEAYETEEEEDLVQASTPTVTYHTHVQTYGWEKTWKKDGEMSGTQGQSKRLEGIEIKVEGDANLGIRYRTHIQTYGWENGWKADGQMSGTSGQAKRLEAIQIELTGADASKYDVWYCVHAQHYGWLNWARNGAEAGTAGYAYRLEGIKIRILPKGSNAPAKEGTSQAAFYSKSDGPSVNQAMSGVAYNTHVQTYGWQDYVYNGTMAGTQGQSKRLEGIHISLVNPPYSGGIEYQTHIQSIGWQGWKSNGAMSGTSGQSKRLEAIQIRLTGEMANKYDVYYRVHAQHFGWMGWAKNGASAGTAGYAYRLEGIQIILVNKGGAAPSTSLGGNQQAVAEAFSENFASIVFKTIAGNYQVYRMGGYSRDTMAVSQNGVVSGESYIQNISMGGMDYCKFTGSFTDLKKMDEYTYSAKLKNYSVKGTPGSIGTEGSFKVQYFDIGYNNKTVTIYLPGHKISTLSSEAYNTISCKYYGKKVPDKLEKACIYVQGGVAYSL